MTGTVPSAHPPVVEWLAEHKADPALPTFVALCALIEAADDRIVGEVKWNAPSYLVTEHFATTGLPPKGGVRLVLHTGATKRAEPLTITVDDPHRLLEWKGTDRAVMMFRSPEAVEAAGAELTTILRQWIAQTQ